MGQICHVTDMKLIKELLSQDEALENIVVNGWVRSRRDSKAFSFFALNDGSCVGNLQVIVDAGIPGSEKMTEANTGASVSITGNLVPSPGKNQKWELQAVEFRLLGGAPEDFPLQKKGHTREFLREIAHLRPRTNLFGAVFRIRSRATLAVHQFFQERGFHNVHTPILTTSDCEGAGEMFQVVVPDKKEEFFGEPAFLTVSGQLEGETFATALSRIYTFGPTFRAENSNTSRHAAEFWMIEPEIAFCDLKGDMDLAEDFLCAVIRDTLDYCAEDIEFLNKFVDKELLARLEGIVAEPFARISYREALELLEKSGKSFEYEYNFESGLQSEHERYLCEEYFQKPTIVFDYPKSVKPFYMKQNDDGETVAAMDVLVPGIGEIIGGSQREDDLEVLTKAVEEHEIDAKHYEWYVELRKYGSVPHAGFGLGFERLIMLLTGVSNIRDVIPFPRTPGNCKF